MAGLLCLPIGILPACRHFGQNGICRVNWHCLHWLLPFSPGFPFASFMADPSSTATTTGQSTRARRRRHSRTLQHLPSITALQIRGPVGPRHLPTNQFRNRLRQGRRVRPRHQRQIGRVEMGELEQSVLQQLLLRIHPFRKYIWALCGLSVLLALLIILNSVWIIAVESSALRPVGDTSFVVFSEVLAWMLLLLSALGMKMTCMASKAVEAETRNRISAQSDLASVELAMALELMEQRRPFSAPNWVPSGGWPGAGPFDLPGAVPGGGRDGPALDPFLFPPPPPRYSSLELPAPVMVQSGGIRRASLLPTVPGRRPSPSASSDFLRSPPPPYCTPS